MCISSAYVTVVIDMSELEHIQANTITSTAKLNCEFKKVKTALQIINTTVQEMYKCLSVSYIFSFKSFHSISIGLSPEDFSYLLLFL